MKMPTSWMSVWLIAFYIMSLAIDSFEELIMVKSQVQEHLQQLTCITENDGSAFVMNLGFQFPSSTTGTVLSWTGNNQIKIQNSSSYREHWILTNSLQHPMGPILDYRWQDFPEHRIGDPYTTKGYHSLILRGPPSGTIVFSARGLGDIHILICKVLKPTDDSCSRITIEASPNKSSVIPLGRNKAAGVTEFSSDCDESKLDTELNQPFISEYEWRTFVFEWRKGLMKTQAYSSTNCVFITNEKQIDPEGDTNIYVGASSLGFIRPHIYAYSLSTTENAKLYTLPFSHGKRNLCIEMLISLCPECVLNVYVTVIGNQYKKMIGSIYGNRHHGFGNLPSWRFERLNTTLHNPNATQIRLEISAQKNVSAVKGRWAIDSIRKCPSDPVREFSTLVYGKQEFTRSWEYVYVFPTDVARCQKFSYTKNTVVGTEIQNAHNITSELIKPFRKLKYPQEDNESSDWYKGKFLCDQTGCTCAPGFNGSNCETACSDSFYGYACREHCGNCESGTCGTTNGFCPGNCADNYLPPYCTTKLEAPVVSQILRKSAVLQLAQSAELDSSKIRNFQFELKTSNGIWIELKTKTPSYPISEIRICGLVAGTKYTARATIELRTANEKLVHLNSLEKDFSTENSAQPTMPNNEPCIIGTCNLGDQNPRIPSSLSCAPSSASNNLLNIEVIDHGKGQVTLKWYHPPYTCTEISRFNITIDFVKTKLKSYPLQRSPILKTHVVEDNEQEYTIDLNLLTSTCYNISVEAINRSGTIRMNKTSFQVPSSVGFSNGETPVVRYHENCIELTVPPIANATKDGRMLVIVKGLPPRNTFPKPPQYLRDIINMAATDAGWIAKNLSTAEISSSKNLTIGLDPNGITSEGCLLDIAEDYEIAIILEISRVDMSATVVLLPRISFRMKKSNETLTWVTVLFILIICFVILFLWRRKFWNTVERTHGRDLLSYPQALTVFFKSATTCTSRQSLPMPGSANNSSSEACGVVSTSSAVAWNRYSRSVNIENFEDYVKDSVSNGSLKSQFAMFPRGLIRASKYGSLPENKPKNRYPNIVPYDDTRVVLKKIPNDHHSDYINANYVQSSDKKRTYIAAQGPKPQTIVDFWRMIWQVETPVICMLTNIMEGQKIKCQQYWPEFGDKKTYGDFIIVTEKYEVFADYTFRTFRVSCKEESRKIEHLHFTGWPDHSVPTYSNSVIKYLKKLQAIPVGKKPIIVHCSAGIGRTGTIILCDICSRHAIAKGAVDVLMELKKLRHCRMNLVDNELQYLFVHVVLAEFLVSSPTELDCNNDLPQATKEMKKKLPQHMERLRDIVWQDEALQFQLSPRPPNPEQLAKNRFPELAPVSADLVFLKRYPTHDNNSDYISAIVVDGARTKRQYLASQLPLPSTLADFWRLIAEQRIQLVIVLQSPDPYDPTCCDIIPTAEEPFNPVPFINVELKVSSGPEKPPRAVELLLRDTSEGKERTQRVHILTCIEWGLGINGSPPPPNELVELWTASENVHREEGPTLVLCHNGITGCGLYLSLSFMLERMTVERECDVIFAVRAIRRARAEFVQSQEQFEYLYDAAAAYVESFETYSNFT